MGAKFLVLPLILEFYAEYQLSAQGIPFFILVFAFKLLSKFPDMKVQSVAELIRPITIGLQ